MNCPGCGEPSPSTKRFCTNCGAQLPRQCHACGAANPPAAKYCGDCGSPLAVAQPLAGISDSEAERRQLTVMFCDLVDSTELVSTMDPEEFAAVIRQFRSACADVVADHNGMIAQYLGDGFVAYFGYTRAHEDDAERAIQTGLDIVEAVRGLDVRDGVHVRVGIATGLVVVGDAAGGGVAEASVLGDTPHRAARLQAEAAPDTVVIGSVTKRLAGGVFIYENLGERRLKGFPTVSGQKSFRIGTKVFANGLENRPDFRRVLGWKFGMPVSRACHHAFDSIALLLRSRRRAEIAGHSWRLITHHHRLPLHSDWS